MSITGFLEFQMFEYVGGIQDMNFTSLSLKLPNQANNPLFAQKQEGRCIQGQLIPRKFEKS
jgi:hypothetical protein